MTLQQFLSVTKDVPPAKVTHAMDTVLAGGPPPRTTSEFLRFHALVWLELQGRLEQRGGPRNSDRLLRWDPDPGEGVWHATEETELSG